MEIDYREILEDKLDEGGKVIEVSVIHRHPSFPIITFVYEKTKGQTGDYLIIKRGRHVDAKGEIVDTAYTEEGAVESLYFHALRLIYGEHFKYRRNGEESKTILHPEELREHMLKGKITQNIAKLVNKDMK